MNILLLSSNKGRFANISLRRPLHLMSVMLIFIGVAAVGAYVGFTFKPSQDNLSVVREWQDEIRQQQVALNHVRQRSDASVDALSSRLGLLQAHVMRLDAVGRKLIHMASIDSSEFNFDSTPAMGGPETTYETDLLSQDLEKSIIELSYRLGNRENQLRVLESLVMNQNLQKDVQPSGRPILKGWLSSHYGMRTHPLTGRREMHKGIDFAGKMGGKVIAVAKGVVTYAGKRYGYGRVIDIAHGNGYVTRYAHNSRLLVSIGDTVEKGFQIAEIGSSGRSTGPHVHFEVLKDGLQVNPVRFIQAAN
ncbi:MAG: murein DD-endopeptidase MepM/ murein hydrolase activator NlpD [Gammaproteobacteria bacterium]|jgi:murein DD-endopeptidase MepM/ murein hydrolase activator NlpD